MYNLYNIIIIARKKRLNSEEIINLLEMVNQELDKLERIIFKLCESKNPQYVEEVWKERERLGLLLYGIIEHVDIQKMYDKGMLKK